MAAPHMTAGSPVARCIIAAMARQSAWRSGSTEVTRNSSSETAVGFVFASAIDSLRAHCARVSPLLNHAQFPRQWQRILGPFLQELRDLIVGNINLLKPCVGHLLAMLWVFVDLREQV